MPSFFFAILRLMTTLSLVLPSVLAQSGNGTWDWLSRLDQDPDGYLHIADDGVARYYVNDTVTSYVALSNDQLMNILSDLPAPWQNETEHLHSVFDGVDGHDVVNQTQLVNPPASLRRTRGTVQSQSTKRNVESLLERAYPACVGSPCYPSAACTFQGCSSCAYLDAILPSEQGICV